MSSDVKIPEWAMLEAGKIADLWQHPMHHDHQILSQDIALALLAAEQRGRKAGLEEAATVAGTRGLKDHPRLSPGSEMNAWWSGQEIAAEEIAAAIRSLGEKI